jgi:hypothetical protein
MDRWRGRASGLSIAAAIVVVLASGATAAVRGPSTLAVRAQDGAAIARVELPAEGRFALRYRNSLYGSLVEEHFFVTPDGRLRLTGLAADELAVLEEYYAIDEPAIRRPVGDPRAWGAPPPLGVEEATILIAATDLGERTLLVDGVPPLELWRLVDDSAPSVWLEIDR